MRLSVARALLARCDNFGLSEIFDSYFSMGNLRLLIVLVLGIGNEPFTTKLSSPCNSEEFQSIFYGFYVNLNYPHNFVGIFLVLWIM